MKPYKWLLLFGLLLVAGGLLFFGMLRKLEKDQLYVLEDSMLDTAQAISPVAANQLIQPGSVEQLWQNLVTTQNATGSRIRILDQNRDLLADSLNIEKDPQSQLRFRPEVQAAYTGNYGAYTRFADENPNSLALFVAWPIRTEQGVIGVVYVSHTTDDILQQLGVMRKSANRLLIILSVLLFLGAVLLTGRLRETLGRLRILTNTAREQEPQNIEITGSDQVAEIGENFNRLVDSLRGKVSQLEDEKSKTKLFLEDVAHELKTPITGLLGSVETLQEGDLEGADRDKLLQNVEKEAQRLSHLTSKLLELQKLDYSEVTPEDFDLLSVAETVADSYERAAAKKSVELEIDSPDEMTACRGDAHKIRRVLENLVENAVRCTPEGSKVLIRLVPNGAATTLRVEDEGPGPPEPSAFQRHHQGEKGQGSLGIGLSIAQEILKKHDQELEVEALEKGGSSFGFQLPISKPE